MKLENIDTLTTAGKARVMQLAAEGRKVVWRENGDAQWRTGGVEWNWGSVDYAIIAEPVGPDEVWIQQRNGALWAYPEERDGSVRYIRDE